MSPLDVVAAGVDGAGAVLDRVDVERISDLVADLAVADVASSIATAAGALGDQAAIVVERSRRTSATTRLAVLAGIVVVAVGAVILIRRRRSDTAEPDTAATLTAA